MGSNKASLLREIVEKGALDDDLTRRLSEAIRDFKERFKEERAA